MRAFKPSSGVHAHHLIPFLDCIDHYRKQTTMENKKNLLRKLVALATAILVTLEGSSGAAAATELAGPCSGTLSSLSVCLPAVEGESPPSPTDACCAVVRSTDASCLCTVVTAYSNSMGVNMYASLLLPKECKKVVPSGYTCDGYGVPSFVPQNRKLMSVLLGGHCETHAVSDLKHIDDNVSY